MRGQGGGRRGGQHPRWCCGLAVAGVGCSVGALGRFVLWPSEFGLHPRATMSWPVVLLVCVWMSPGFDLQSRDFGSCVELARQ